MGPAARNIRMAAYSTKAVTFTGLHCELANDRLRRSSPLAVEAQRRPMYDNVAAPPTPTATWARGVRDPQPLLRAIEQALVDAAPAGRIAHGRDERAHTPPVVPELPRCGRIRG
ncbi:MAG TPA: hypothetical protein VNP20_18595 [Nocardioidaceae bacterium]|nr:hypothetical protein [Nocardioidaceae bacterium]